MKHTNSIENLLHKVWNKAISWDRSGNYDQYKVVNDTAHQLTQLLQDEVVKATKKADTMLLAQKVRNSELENDLKVVEDFANLMSRLAEIKGEK